MLTPFSSRFIFLTLLVSTPGLANCDHHCLEQLLSQITTLRSEIRSAIPIGTILPYSGSQALPQGYIPCNGQLLEQAGTYQKLFEVIRYSFIRPGEREGTHFRVPNLNGKTLVGTKTGDNPIALGDWIGSETQQLQASNLPPHKHSGTTKSNNRDHTHNGRTGDDSPDHSHTYLLINSVIPIYNGVPVNHAGSSHNIAQNKHEDRGSGGANTKHQHDFTTGNQSQNHEHRFTTDNGDGLNSTPFSVMQPSLGVRFMIKAE